MTVQLSMFRFSFLLVFGLLFGASPASSKGTEGVAQELCEPRSITRFMRSASFADMALVRLKGHLRNADKRQILESNRYAREGLADHASAALSNSYFLGVEHSHSYAMELLAITDELVLVEKPAQFAKVERRYRDTLLVRAKLLAEVEAMEPCADNKASK